ncbi:cytochrome C oxidase subunit IV family protein [Vulgatibacter incomptus]|uniref:Uncharacterized protein n=1 Tax=Vulgatibacter incomptus TaxID=1391653 RepID=A0A0K1P9N8_9BACT|nr:cytochrome C oxidase subunit IV family protein [Vulgatibacter incomptus]AKU90243.1 hypothetical protein AKJ08_0630 [Vulgatibacter incomptus]
MTAKPVSLWLFPAIGAVLYLLIILSFVLSYVEMGPWATPIALIIAGIQAVLVAYVSMELYESRFSVKMLAIIAPLFVALLVTLAAVDIATRAPQPMLVPVPVRTGLPGTHPNPMQGVPGPPVHIP